MSYVDQHSAMCTFLKNEPVFFPADPRKYIFFLKKGLVKISRYSDDGRELILDIIGPGEVFGQLTMGVDGPESTAESAVALEEVLLCNIYRGDFDRILEKYPRLNYQLTRLVGSRLRKIEQRVADLVFKDVRQRIISFLLDFAIQFGTIHHGVITLRPALSHLDIGNLTGSSRQTVNATLNSLRDAGYIRFNRREIVLVKPDLLRLESGSPNR